MHVLYRISYLELLVLYILGWPKSSFGLSSVRPYRIIYIYIPLLYRTAYYTIVGENQIHL